MVAVAPVFVPEVLLPIFVEIGVFPVTVAMIAVVLFAIRLFDNHLGESWCGEQAQDENEFSHVVFLCCEASVAVMDEAIEAG
jgi:hypothetical protein